MHWEARFQDVAASHHGLIAKFHLPEIDCTSDHWWRAIRSGRWHREGRRVLRSGGAALTLEQRLLAALLDASPGAVLHGPSALAYQGLRGYNLADIHVARARDISGAPAELARLHELRALRAHHVTVLHGIVTETALRAIWCEAARYARAGGTRSASTASATCSIRPTASVSSRGRGCTRWWTTSMSGAERGPSSCGPWPPSGCRDRARPRAAWRASSKRSSSATTNGCSGVRRCSGVMSPWVDATSPMTTSRSPRR